MPRFDPEETGASLDWKQFESYAECAFSACGFSTQRNTRFRKPSAEIDLVARKGEVAFAVDCKHWKRTVGHSSMLAVSERQLKRAMRLASGGKVGKVIPVVLTLRDENLYILENGIPIVPIHRISDFLLNWETSAQEIRVVSAKAKEKMD